MKTKASKVLDLILIEMYRVAVPYVDLVPYLNSEKPLGKLDYRNYWLPIEIQFGIERRICNEYKLKSYEKERIHFNITLGASPNTDYRNWYINMLQHKYSNTEFYNQNKKIIDEVLTLGSYEKFIQF